MPDTSDILFGSEGGDADDSTYVPIDDTPLEDPEKAEEPEAEPDPEPETEEESKAEPESDDEPDLAPAVPGKVLLDSLKAKHPEIFKEFSDLRSAIMRGYAYYEVFPDIGTAKEAAADAESFRQFESEVTSGDSGGLLQSLKEVGAGTYTKFVDNFLPTLFSTDQQAFARVVTPILNNAIANVHRSAVDTKDENLRRAALYFAKFYTGTTKVPDYKDLKREETPEDKKLQEERSTFESARYESFRNEVVDDVSEAIREMVGSSIKGLELTKFVKDGILRSVMEEVSEVLRNDRAHISNMKRIWDTARREHFKVNPKPRIRSAYLGRAKTLVPTIVSRLISEAGVTKAAPANSGKKVFPSKGGAPKPGVRASNIDPKKVDWSKASTKDVLFGDTIPMRN